MQWCLFSWLPFSSPFKFRILLHRSVAFDPLSSRTLFGTSWVVLCRGTEVPFAFVGVGCFLPQGSPGTLQATARRGGGCIVCLPRQVLWMFIKSDQASVSLWETTPQRTASKRRSQASRAALCVCLFQVMRVVIRQGLACLACLEESFSELGDWIDVDGRNGNEEQQGMGTWEISREQTGQMLQDSSSSHCARTWPSSIPVLAFNVLFEVLVGGPLMGLWAVASLSAGHQARV